MTTRINPETVTPPPQTPFQIPSNIIRKAVNKFASRANELADRILVSNTSYQSTPVIVHDHHHWGWPGFWQPRPSVVVVDQRRNNFSAERKREREKEDAAVVGFIAAAALAVLFYCVGTGVSAYMEASEELKDAQAFSNTLDNFSDRSHPKDHALIAEAFEAAHLKGRICARKKSSELTGLILKVGLATAFGSIAGGSYAIYRGGDYLAYGVLKNVGLAAGAIFGSISLFRLGLNSTDSENKRDAIALKESIEQIKRLSK